MLSGRRAQQCLPLSEGWSGFSSQINFSLQSRFCIEYPFSIREKSHEETRNEQCDHVLSIRSLSDEDVARLGA